MEERRTGYVKSVTFGFLVQNRFILAMFCSVFIDLFIERIISISPLSGESDFFLANKTFVRIDYICVLIKHHLIIFLNRNRLNKMCCLERLLMLPHTERAPSR